MGVVQRTIFDPLLSSLIQSFNIIYTLTPNSSLQCLSFPTLQTHTFTCLLDSSLCGLMGLLSHYIPFLNDFLLSVIHTTIA